MLNQKFDGKSVDVVLTADAASGELLQKGDLTGIVTTAGKAGETRALQLHGVYELPKATGVGSGYSQGTTLYWDPVAGKLTETAGALKKAGQAFEATLDTDTTTLLRLNNG